MRPEFGLNDVHKEEDLGHTNRVCFDGRIEAVDPVDTRLIIVAAKRTGECDASRLHNGTRKREHCAPAETQKATSDPEMLLIHELTRHAAVLQLTFAQPLGGRKDAIVFDVILDQVVHR